MFAIELAARELIRRVVVDGGRAGGYQVEVVAASAVVRAVERLLADHRGLLSDGAALGAQREILEVFVDAGWPDALRVSCDLDDLFR